LKIDTVDNRTISDDQLEFLCSAISSSKADAYVFSDFRHGIFNKRTIPLLRQSVPQAAFKVADSQVASRWGNILEFQGFDLITPNEREARFATGDQDSGIRTIASEVFELSSCKMLVLKLSDRGILTQTGTDASTLDSYFVMDSFAGNIKDAVGAGDALLAYTTLTMLVSKNPVISSILGNLAAACECEIEGNVPITPENILKKIDAIEQEAKYELSSP
jgi:sugar/nucleoside kinase (ribokinase family)